MCTLLCSATMAIAAVVVFYIMRTIYCLYIIRTRRIPQCDVQAAKTMVILGSGGHTAEMMCLLRGLDRKKYTPMVYVRAQTDTTSEVRIRRAEEKLTNLDHCEFLSIPRSREVMQSWISTIWTTFYALLYSLYTVYTVKPELILTNGPGTCMPLCWAAFLYHVVLFRPFRVIFVESFCRVDTLSLSGKLLYPLASRFIVQWPQLVEMYPRAQYIGRLV